MKLHYCGKYNGKEESLPRGEHKPNAVKFKEPDDAKKLALVANGIAIGVGIIVVIALFVRGGIEAYHPLGFVPALLTMFPHEILHALCFKKDVYLYTNLKQGMLFVVGPEDMSKRRFIWMSLCPNIVFGALPFLLFLVCPQWSFLGTWGAFALTMGAGDYLNVFNALTQMPKGARTYLYGFHSYWYMP